MKAEKNAQAADDGDDARNRHQNVGDRHPLRGGIGHLLMRKVAEAASDKNQRIEDTSQGDKVAHGFTHLSVFKSGPDETLRSLQPGQTATADSILCIAAALAATAKSGLA